ncbi:MAG: hypothetical protein ABWZ03_08130 [Solirubrobacterales bacterium]
MTDSHLRLLAAVARHREATRVRRADLSHQAIRARKQMSAARARRRLARHDPD